MLLHAFPRNLVVRIKAEFALQIVRKRRSLRQPPLKVVRSLEAVLDFFLIKAEAQQVSFTMMQWTLRSCGLCWMCLLGETGPSPWTNQDAWPKCCSASLRDDELNNENVTVFFFLDSLSWNTHSILPQVTQNQNSCVLAAWSGPQRNSSPSMTSCVLSTHDVIRGHNCTYAQRRTCSTQWGAHKQTQASSLVQRVLF